MAAQLYETLQTRLLSLPNELEIYPGHQAGSACGAGLSGKPASTIGFEKRFNPMLAMDQPAFVGLMLSFAAVTIVACGIHAIRTRRA